MKSETKLYELITPSDPIVFAAVNDKVAYTCSILLGNGKAGCKREDGESIPTMIMFDPDPEKTMQEYLGEPMKDFISKNMAEIADCFDSFSYGDFEDKRRYEDAVSAITDPVKLKEFKAKHEDRNRSSMSQWVKGAWNYAEGIRKKLKSETA